MKNHQYAIKPTPFSQMLKELKAIHFYNDKLAQLKPAKLFKQLLLKSFPNEYSQTMKLVRLHDYMATPDQEADTYLDQHNHLTFNVFYDVALQLLRFDLDLDYKLSDPLTCLKKSNVPYLKPKDKNSLTTNEVFRAWYLLLNTHTKFDQTFLDELASLGYYAQFSDLPKPLFFNGKAQPVFDSKHVIHEVVYVEAPLDTDHDGKRDLLRTDVVRPGETEQGLKVPTIFTADPYNLGTNDRMYDKMYHKMDVPLKRKQPNHATYKDVESHFDPTKNVPAPRKIKKTTKTAEASSYDTGRTYTLDQYFLARGFAIVYSSGVGTYDSQGVRTTESPAEVISATSIINWLTGDRTAFTNPKDRIAIPAWWSNHCVGMTGLSYLGTLVEAVATTGVKGFKAGIAEAAISNWYDYYRDHGLVMGNEDTDLLAEFTFSQRKSAGEFHRSKAILKKQLKHLQKEQDRQTGNYNRFWDNRNYLKNAHKTKASLIIVQGLNDDNVKPRNAWNMWQRLQNVPVSKKLLLHQGKHMYVYELQSLDFIDMANLFFSNKLYGVDNHSNRVLPSVIVQDNTKPQTWHTYDNWGHTGHELIYRLNNNQLDPDQFSSLPLSFQDHLEKKVFKHYGDETNAWYSDVFSSKPNPMSNNRLLFKSEPLKHDLFIDGVAHLKLRVKSSANVGLLTAFLVDYGKAKRLTTAPQYLGTTVLNYRGLEMLLRDYKHQEHATPYKKIVTAHLNLQNRHNSYRVDDLKPNQYVDVNLEFQPTFFHILPKHQLGLVVCATDFNWTVRGNQKIRYTVDPKHSQLILPIYKK